MSKVLVDRELLERLQHVTRNLTPHLQCHEDLRAILAAQPAEAEGVGKWSELKKLAEKATPGPWWVDSHGHRVSTEDGTQTVFIAADKMGPATRHPETGNLSHWPNDWDASYIVNASPDKVLELIAALSAVTAERDGLAAARMAYANEFAPDENGDPDVGNVHANIRALKAERDRLANAFGDCVNSLHAEMLQKYGGQLPEDMHPVTRRDYDRDMEEIAEYRAAMAAKEA